MCKQKEGSIDPVIREKVENMAIKNIKRSIADFLIILKPISVALDTLQRQNVNMFIAVMVWRSFKLNLNGIIY